MLETIFSWLLSAVGEGLQLFVNFFFGNGNDGGLLNFTLGDLYQNFPYFGTAYAVLQACGLGLVLAIAAVNLFKVFLGSLSKAQDTPTQILVRAALATVLIYLGGYLLSAVVGIAKVPYDIFVNRLVRCRRCRSCWAACLTRSNHCDCMEPYQAVAGVC